MAPSSWHWLPWAPLTAAILHVTEEFILPGGFSKWYRAYRGAAAASVTPRFLFIINAVLLAASFDAGWAFRSRHGVLYWLFIASVLGSNGVWHLWAAARSRSYSPGMVTGLLQYVPLALVGLTHFVVSGAVTPLHAAAALALGGSYPWWSALFHSRGSARTA